MKQKVLNKTLRSVINPLNLYRACGYAKRQKETSRTKEDPQLRFYSEVLHTNMLHYGYFEDSAISWADICFRDMEEAQMAYAEKICGLVSTEAESILDAGAGMGGLGNLLQGHGYFVTCLTPDKHQAEYIRANYPNLIFIESKYQDMQEKRRYSTVIHSESLQYIPLGQAFEKTEKIMETDGEWIVSDYFRRAKYADSGFKSGHIFEDFEEISREKNWKIVHMEDITSNVLPTLSYAYNFACRFLRPAIEFADGKLKQKQPFIRYYTDDIIDHLNKKFEKGIEGVNPERFLREKRYLLLKMIKK
ncbi:MAG: hypothetical protein K9J85_09870 [Desulfobacteraceae bacterium]|nr:hypothetical protein [Desulfobacteraceae bacterium]